MWVFEQSSGRMSDSLGRTLADGYAGNGAGKNNPAMQNVHQVGPLPVGLYTILAPEEGHPTGPYTLPLVPDATNVMFGRSEFRIHGDSLESPGNASDGCIVMPPEARRHIWESGDHRLEVIASTDQPVDLNLMES